MDGTTADALCRRRCCRPATSAGSITGESDSLFLGGIQYRTGLTIALLLFHRRHRRRTRLRPRALGERGAVFVRYGEVTGRRIGRGDIRWKTWNAISTKLLSRRSKNMRKNQRRAARRFWRALPLFHSIDYLAYDKKRRKTNKGTTGNLRKAFGKDSSAFARIDEIAHAFKHVVSSGRRKLRAEEVISRPAGRLGEMQLGLSRLGHSLGGVTLSSSRM